MVMVRLIYDLFHSTPSRHHRVHLLLFVKAIVFVVDINVVVLCSEEEEEEERGRRRRKNRSRVETKVGISRPKHGGGDWSGNSTTFWNMGLVMMMGMK